LVAILAKEYYNRTMRNRIENIFILILLLLAGCFPPKIISESEPKPVFNDPHFFYDEENYTLIRVNPETRKKDIEKYMNSRDKTSPSAISKKEIPKDTAQYIPPKPKKLMKPYYPQEAKLKGYSSVIILEILIDSTGMVTEAKLLALETQSGKLKSKLPKTEPKTLIVERDRYIKKPNKIEKLLIESTLESAIQSEFSPAYDGKGKPVPVWISFPVRFILENKKSKDFPPNLVP